MARPAADRIKAIWTGTGTGTMTLGGAASGEAVQAFPSSLDGQIVTYLVHHETAAEAEVGYGLYTHSGPTLSRLYRYYPTPGGAAVSFSSGTKFVSPTPSSSYLVSNIATTSPTVNDDITSGFLMGHTWLNSSTDQAYLCVDHADGAAVWKELGTAAGAASFASITGVPADNTALQTALDGKADTSHQNLVSDIVGGSDGELMGWGVDDVGEAKNATSYLNPNQVSGGEMTAGTETALRSFAPADVKSMAATHGGGGASGLNPVDSASTTLTLNQTNVGNLYDFITDGTINLTLDAQTTVPGSGSKVIGIRKAATGTVNVIMESGAAYFVAGDDYGGTPATATFQVTGFAWVEIRSNSGGSNAVFIVGGDTSLPKTVSGPVAFSGAITHTGSDTIDFGGRVVQSNLGNTITSVTGTLTNSHLGRMIVTSGNITVPTTTGFNVLVKAGGAHTITFNSTVTAAATTGQVCSVFVQSATVVVITPWTTPQTLT